MKIFFDKFSSIVSAKTGSSGAFFIAFTVIVIWGISGPIFNFSDTWQLVINTGTTVITFLMVFLIQQAQNKDTKALQLKLNELIACNKAASNRLIDIEDLSSDEIEVLKNYYVELSKLSAKEKNIYATHSLDEAKRIHAKKNQAVEESHNGNDV